MAQFNVNLAFSADTGKAKAQIQELQLLLNKIAYTGSTKTSLTTGIEEAATAAKQLQFHLNNAFNATTGKFDLSLLDRSLKTSNSSIRDLSLSLLNAGTDGQQAFLKLAQSISLADQPMLRISNRMKEFGVTLKNTVKWQLSSSMMHGFMGSIQSAYGYAKDLNKSLNDIRIVTGYNTDQMAEFAEQANKAAKNLSTTTTDYTKASLIYFQQGLSDAEVTERTDVTIKMANAAGQSAQIVSDQLTAVWNNFDNGTKSLKYYADVMTALGAATATSTDEISQGLSKFAAVAETVGLSYEYATAALATITSNTRESADVVGNALKTLFARLQGLKLGETLEDGVDLNKYSEALDKAGISIFQSNGELKAMDNILTELANKWDTMNNSQQVALAQTVAGVRQYTQLIALMDNWDSGDADSMMANLKTISESDGALDKQADTYAQSWEAAEKRVKASLEGIYQTLLKDEFFIGLNNGFANVLKGLDSFVDKAGGLKTLLITISGVIAGAFANKIPEALDTFKYNLEVVTKGTQSAYQRIQNQMTEAQNTAFDDYGIDPETAMGYAIKTANELTAARNKLALVSDKMSASELQYAQMTLGIIESQQQEAIAIKQKNEQLKETIRLKAESFIDPNGFDAFDRDEKANARADKALEILAMSEQQNIFGENFNEQLENIPEQARIMAENLNTEIVTAIKDMNSTAKIGSSLQPFVDLLQKIKTAEFKNDNITAFQTQIKGLTEILPKGIKEILNVDKALKELGKIDNQADLDKWIEDFSSKLADAEIETKDFARALKGVNKDPKVIKELLDLLRQYQSGADAAEKAQERLNKSLENFKPEHIMRAGEALGQLGNMLGSLVGSIASFGSALRNIFNPDISGWEKFLAILSAVSSGLILLGRTITSAVKVIEWLNNAEKIAIVTKSLNAAASFLQAKATKQASDANKEAINSIKAETQALEKNSKEKIKNAFTNTVTDQTDDNVKDVKDAVDLIDDIFKNYKEKLSNVKDGVLSIFEALRPVLLNFGKAILQFLKGLVSIKTALIGIAAISIVGIYQWLTKDARAAEEAAKKYEEVKKKQEELKQSYDSLKSAISNIDSGYEALSTMTKGTDEWRSAVVELNTEIMNLINMYPALAGAIRSVDGVLALDKNSDAYKNFINAEMNKIAAVNIEASAAQSNKAETQYQSDYTNARREWFFKTGNDQLFNDLINDISLLDAENLKKHLEGKYHQSHIPGIIETIMSNADIITNLNAQKLNRDSTLSLAGQSIASNALINNEEYQASDFQDEINTAIGNYYNNNDFYKTATTQEALAAAAAYAEQFGYTFQNQIGYNGATFKDSEGNQIKTDWDTIATASQAGDIASQVSDLMNSITDESLRNLLSAAIAQNENILTKEDYDKQGDVESLYGDKLDLIKSIFGDNIINILSEYLNKEWTFDKFNLDQWKSDYASKMNIIKDLETGDTISAEDYSLLGEEYQQYFQVQADGTAILIQKAEELRTAIEGIEIQELKDNIQSQQNIIDSADEKYSAATGIENVDIDLLNKRAQSMIDNTSAWAEGYGTSSQFTGIQGMMDAVGMTEDDLAIYTTAEEKIRAIGQAWLDLQNNLNNNQQVLANVATSLRDLETQLEDGIIDIEEYNNAFDLVIAKEAELNDLDYESILDFAKYLQETNDELKNEDQLCKKIALSYHRWDKGVKTISENFDDWVKNIKDGNKNSLKYINTLSTMRNAYKDVFSEIDPEIIDQLGEAFLTNKDNLKLLEQGLAGNEQAWNDWESTVLQELNNINPAFANISAEMKNQMNELVIAAANLDFSGLTPGASIDDADFNAKLNAMVFNTAEAAQAMCDNLSSVGVDAEIVPHTQVVDGYTANTTQSGSFSFFDEKNKSIGTVSFTGGAVEKKQPHTETFYTLEGATYNGKGVSAGGGGYRGNKGGGGGGSKQPKHAEKKSDSDKTRYHTLTNQLEDLKSEYDEIAKASDRAFGQEKLDNIDAEIEKTDELIKKQEEYVKAIADNLPVDKAVMEAYYQDTIGGPAMKFDERGNISNYDEIQDAMFNKYNAMTSHDEESLEWQTFEKKYEQLEKYIEQYEETYDLLRDEETAYQELLNQRIDLELEKVQYKVELELTIPEDEIALIEYQLGRIDEDAFKSAESIELLTRQAESLYDQIQINKQGLNDALSLSLSAAEIVQVLAGDASVLDGKVFTEEQIDAIKEYRDNLLDLNEEFDNVRESIEEQVMEVFDAWNEKLQEGTETLEHYGSILESYKNIVDIVGKDTLGLSNKFMEDLDKAAVDSSINEVLAAKDAYESMLETQKAAQEALEDARVRNDEASIQMWEENLRTINEESRSMQEELLSKWEDALDTIATMFESTVERVIEAFNESIYALGGLEGLSEEFSRQQEIADILVDDYKKIYELSKLNRDINKAIDDTELIGGKQKLKKLLQEINKLQEDGVEMSEYDLEYLQKTFDLRMAELELEEAQRAKNTVRLSKDNEGNWSYIYTQNTDAVDAAQQKYEDALYAMQDLSSNYIDEMSEQLISTSQEMAEALAEIRIQDYASIDDYYAEVERVQQQYQDELAMQESELQKAIDNNKQLYDEDWTNYHAATGYKISDTEDFVTTFKDSMLGSMLDSESATANFTDILTEATETLTAGLMTGAMDYYIALEEAMNAAGTSTGDFATDTSKNIDQIVEKSKEGAEAVDQMALEMQEALGAVIDTVSTWQETYGTAMQNIIDINLEVIKSFNDMLEALSVGGNTTVTVDYNIENSPESILNPSQFDTGGYTGTWGNTGKLAILHEKELILEPKDTVNMLNALKISKSMLDTIELNAQQASRGIGYTTPTVIKEDNTQTLEQMVHITAEFPHVTDHNEIEEAFKNLTNTASQYANRK